MVFERFFVEGLAHASYLIACDRTRRAIVIDPRRDVDAYLTFAAQRGLTIADVVETHIHADFVSGARELRIATGAGLFAGPGADLGFPYTEVAHRQQLAVGDTTLEFLHTPGHTPEHISIVVRAPGAPARLFSGDTLFVGAVGRPDLLGEEMSRLLAGQLYDSLFGVLLALHDEVEVHPAHGAGSLCGKGISAQPSSTIGAERRMNPWLQPRPREAFVVAVLDDLPDTPTYFQRMKRINRQGPPVLGLTGAPPLPPALDTVLAHRMSLDGAVMIDMRDTDAFCEAHPEGALNIGFGSRLGYWAGWVVSPDVPVVLLAGDERMLPEAVRQLLRVGFDDIAGYLAGGMDAWRAAGLPIGRISRISASDLRNTLAGRTPLRLLDVRTEGEWEAGHIDGALHVPVGDVPRRAGQLAGEGGIITICEGGYRSTLAASLLARAGIGPLMNVTGGMGEFRKVDGRQ